MKKQKQNPNFKNGEFVTSVLNPGQEFRVTGFQWNGFTYMLSFKDQTMRCGEEYCKLSYFSKYIDGELYLCTHNVYAKRPDFLIDTFYRDGIFQEVDENYQFQEGDFKIIGKIENQENFCDGQIFSETEIFQYGNLYGLPSRYGTPKIGTIVKITRKNKLDHEQLTNLQTYINTLNDQVGLSSETMTDITKAIKQEFEELIQQENQKSK